MVSEQKLPRREDVRPKIEGYEILELIGRGSTGVVYRARQLAVDREVAIKLLHAHLAEEARIVRRLQREARTTARLAHPHIVSAVDMGETNGQWWYAMEFVDGPSLSLRLRQEGRIREREALRLFIPLCEALEHLWEHGVVHRDIKPANILIDRAGGARLADLGLACAEDDPSITGPGGTLGTPHYISPEQAIDPKKADVRSDIWSFGATLFHAVCGRPPFAGDSAAEVLSGVLYARIADPLELEPALSSRLALVLRKCLTRDPVLRYQTPHELLLDLERVRERRAPKVSRRALDPVGEPPTGMRRWLVAGAFGFVAVAGLVLALVFLRGPFAAGAGEDAEGPVAFPPLEELAGRIARGDERPAQLLAELHDLSSRVPEVARARYDALERELGEGLRHSVRTVRDAVQAEVQREIAAGDLAAAWRTYDEELAARLAESSGYRLEELAEAGVNLAPWQTRMTLELEGATDTALADLATALADFVPERLAEVERELERQEWDRALHLLEIPDSSSLLAAAGFTGIRLPDRLLAGLVDDVQDQFRLRADQLEHDWKLVDDELRTFVEKRRSTLEEALRRGPPRIGAADMLREAFEEQLFERRLTREKMPKGLSRAALDLLEESAAQLLELEARLHEEDARADFEEVEELSRTLLRTRAYEEVRALWEEARARLGELERFAQSGWLAELDRRMNMRRTEAQLLEDFLARVAQHLRAIDGQRIDLRWGSITYPQVLVDAGPDPLRDGFRAERIAESIDIRSLPSTQLEELAAFASESTLVPRERLQLALFRYVDDRLEDAGRALFSGPLPEEGPEKEIGSDLAGRITSAQEDLDVAASAREAEAERLLETVLDEELQVRSPRSVQARISILLDEYEDLPLVRRRKVELQRLRTRLETPRLPGSEEEFRRIYRPHQVSTSAVGRLRLEFDFLEGGLGAWEAGDWVFDGLGYVVRHAAERWEDLLERRGLVLDLVPPLVADSFELFLRVEQLGSGPPKCLWISAAGFQVALLGPGLPSAEPAERFLVGTDPDPAFLERLRAGAGRPGKDLLAPSGPHEIRMTANRRTGRLELVLDGVVLEETAGLKAPDPDRLEIVIRSWEPVRVVAAELEAGR